MTLETSCSIRFLLVADVLADLLQFEPDSRDRIPTGPKVLTREVLLAATQSSYGNRALPLQKPDDRGHRVLRWNRDAHVHMVRLQMPFDDLTFLLLGQSMENFPQLPADFSEDNLPPSLGDEHNVVFAVPFRMG